jgi:protein involved in polysaccharide export with SLBB domain
LSCTAQFLTRVLTIVILLATLAVAQEPEYFVTGAVRAPGRFQLAGDLTVEQAIAKAGGTTDAPRGSTLVVKIQRKQGGVRLVFDAKLTEAVLADDRLDVRFVVPKKL